MKGFLLTVKTVYSMIAGGGTWVLLDALRRRVYSLDRSYCLRKDLSNRFDIPEARVSIKLEPLHDGHVDELARAHPDLIPLLKAGIPTGYVAVTEQGDICYMQWLFTSDVNERLQRHLLGRRHLQLKPDEVLLENVYTVERYRGLGIMPSACAQLAEIARSSGARWALTFVREDNIPALKGMRAAGFEPWRMREIRWRLFRRRVTFESPPDMHVAFDAATAPLADGAGALNRSADASRSGQVVPAERVTRNTRPPAPSGAP